MKNPLWKRLPRELKSDLGKYIALFLFLIITIGFVSGFLVADISMKTAYDNSFEDYSIENGHFTLNDKAEANVIEAIEKEDVKVYELFYKDKELTSGHTIRVYKLRDKVNRADLMSGDYPKTDTEIVIDRLYAENNEIKIGDTLKINGKDFKVCGFVAMGDYSSLFKNNTDMMFDANKFTVSMVTESAFDDLNDVGLHYTYAWLNNDTTLSDDAQKDKADELKKVIAKNAMLTDFVCRQDNHAITFTGDDMGGDKVMMQYMLYIVMVVLAFAFAVTTKNTIEQEASVIGTLRASGYTKGELLWHYISLPIIVTLIAAVVGNILGYTAFKYVVTAMYYHSYSLPTYKTIWNGDAFILTTVIPCIIILVVNFIVIRSSLSLPPLQFLRHELKRKKKKRAVKLPNFRFLTRFRIRVILQNIPTFITMFAGIFLACVLLIFGMMFSPLLSKFKTDVQGSKIADYQYILKMPLETETKDAEKYSVNSLINDHEEEITVYGISENSKYLKDIKIKSGDIVLSDGFMEKYGIKVGDEITLSEKYEEKDYKFKVSGSYHYPATLAVFLDRTYFNEIFDRDADSFNGYFSNEKITDIDENMVASVITEHDLTIMADQLEDSMGRIFILFVGFAVILFILIIYLLSKLVIEKNTRYISMIKILGFSDGEAASLYNMSTAIVVVISLLIAIPVCGFAIREIYYAMMLEYSGWLTFYIAPWVYFFTFAIGLLCYFVVHFIEMRKIKKIPLANALKNME